MTFDSREALFYTLLALTPGFFLDRWLRAIAPRFKGEKEYDALRFLGLSVVSYVLWCPLLYDMINRPATYSAHPWLQALLWLLIAVGWPNLAGWTLHCVWQQRGAALAKRPRWQRASVEFVRRRLGEWLRPGEHPIPSAFQYAFEDRPACYVMVTLDDGSQIQGLWTKDVSQEGLGAFASSDPEERDIFLPYVYVQNEYGEWVFPAPASSMWMPMGNVRHIEFIELQDRARS